MDSRKYKINSESIRNHGDLPFKARLKIPGLLRRPLNCILLRCDGGEVRCVLGRHIVHYTP